FVANLDAASSTARTSHVAYRGHGPSFSCDDLQSSRRVVMDDAVDRHAIASTPLRPARSETIGPSVDAHLGHRHDETSAGGSVPVLLGHDLAGEVPGQDQDVVWSILEELVRGEDGQLVAAHV